jgi:hypothetical protein
MRFIDADNTVQQQRARANKAHKEYRRCEREVTKSRKRHIDKALDNLRHEMGEHYEKQSSKYRRVLRDLRASEIRCAQMFLGGRSDVSIDDARSLYETIEESTNIRTRANNNGAFGPMKSRFWSHH